MRYSMRIRRPRPKGYVLIAVLAVIAILVTIVAILQYQGMARRRNAVLMEAQYLARRAFDNTEGVLQSNLEGDLPSGMTEVILLEEEFVSFDAGGDPIGSIDSNSVYVDGSIHSRAGKLAGATIYKNEGRRNIGTTENLLTEQEMHGRDRTTYPLSLRVEGLPTSWNPTFDLFRRNRFQSVYLAGFPYAAFAPSDGATIEIESVRTWAMPTIDEYDPDTVNPLDLDSGVVPLIGAGGNVAISQIRYGEVYSKAGDIEIEGGTAIGLQGYLPYSHWAGEPYFDHLTHSLDKVSDKLSDVSTDKTGAVFGKLTLADTVDWIINGKTPSNFLTYQSASAWWFFLLPRIKGGPGYIDFQLHVPMPADTGVIGDAVGTSPSIYRINELNEQNQEINAELLPKNAGDESEWDANTPGLIPELSYKAGQLEELEQELDQLNSEYQQLEQSGANDSTLEAKQDEIDTLQDTIDTKRDEVDDLDKEIQRKQDTVETNKGIIDNLREDLEDTAMDWIEGDPKGPNQTMEMAMCKVGVGQNPDTKSLEKTKPANASTQEKTKDDKTKWLSSNGMLFHSYAALIVRLAAQVVRIIKNAITSFPMKKIKIPIINKTIEIPDLTKLDKWLENIAKDIAEGLQNLVVYEVPLCFLDAEPLEKITGSNFKIYDTFQVPMGRTFKLDGDMTIYGDLWLQKGSSMTLSGDLTMKKPELEDSMFLNFHSMTQPQGRIYMEEGTSLVVEGDLEGAGDKFMGSVVACGPMGKNRAISAIIICNGTATLPHGTAGGVGFVELIDYIGSDTNARDMRRLFEDWIPNLSKTPMFLSPFYARQPYFGRYPVVLKIIPPSPIPIPTFETKGQNLNVYLFRILTNIMTVQLNLTLGENFSTSCAWWAWSSEQVAVFPKHAGPSFKPEAQKRLNEMLESFGWAGGDAEDFLEPLLSDALKEVKDVEGLAKSLGITAALALNPDPTDASNEIVEDLMEKLLGEKSLQSKANDSLDELNLPIKVPGGIDIDIWKGLKEKLRDIQDAVNALSPLSGGSPSDDQLRESANILLLETPGVFVYAKNSLTVGSGDTVRAVGCFVSEGSVDMDVNYTIGSIVSGQGSIRAQQLYYAPQYSRASVYIPKQLRTGGKGITANDDYWDNAFNFKYGSKLDTEEGMDVPEQTVFFPSSYGWGP